MYMEMNLAAVKNYADGSLKVYEIETSANVAYPTSDPIMIPNCINQVALQVEAFDGAEARFDFTCSTVSNVKDNNATWVAGMSATATVGGDVIFPCTAVRLALTNAAGYAILSVRAQ